MFLHYVVTIVLAVISKMVSAYVLVCGRWVLKVLLYFVMIGVNALWIGFTAQDSKEQSAASMVNEARLLLIS